MVLSNSNRKRTETTAGEACGYFPGAALCSAPGFYSQHRKISKQGKEDSFWRRLKVGHRMECGSVVVFESVAAFIRRAEA